MHEILNIGKRLQKKILSPLVAEDKDKITRVV